MSKVTIKDIAREAGVSISTVSNALNGVDVLKPSTREHILEVASRMHYIPDMNGKNLKAKSTKVIGFFVTSLKGPYFSQVADSMFWECVQHGYEMNIFMTSGGKSAIRNILGRGMDGCVIFSEDVSAEDVQQMAEFEVPTMFLDRNVVGQNAGCVLFDSYKDGALVAEYLINKGIRNIGYIQGLMSHHDAQDRYKGFTERLAQDGIVIDPAYILEGKFEKEAAYVSTLEFVEKGLPLPDVFFTGNDQSAMGCIDALHEKGLKVPEDVMVIGVDDIELSAWYHPSITTVRTNYEEVGPAAIRKLLKLINHEEEGECIRFQGQLIERESTAGIDVRGRE